MSVETVIARRPPRPANGSLMSRRNQPSGNNKNFDALLAENSKGGVFGAVRDRQNDVSQKEFPSQMPQVRFGVVGAGKDRKILGYGSLASSSMMPSVMENEEHSAFGDTATVDVSSSSTGSRRGSLTMDVLQSQRDLDSKQSLDVPKEHMMMSFANWSVSDSGGWSCTVCTYMNQNALHLTCAACGNPRPSKGLATQNLNGFASVKDFLQASYSNPKSDSDSHLEAYIEFEDMVTETFRIDDLVEQQKRIMLNIQQEEFYEEENRANNEDDRLMFKGNDSNNSIEGVRGTLTAAAAAIQELEAHYEKEKAGFDAMVKLQAEREAQIEAEEGVSPREVMENRVTRPGVQSISGNALEWIGQERMLNDWRRQLQARQDEIQFLRASQMAALDSIQEF